MKAITCPKCGAPAEPGAAALPVTCPWCGSTLAATHVLKSAGRGSAAPVVIDLRGARKASGALTAFVLLFVLGILGFSGWMVWTGVRSATEGMRSALSSVPSPARPPDRTVKVADLARLAGGRGWVTLEAAPPPVPLAAFDAVAALPWAVAIAQAWAPDAMVHRVDVERLRPDGTVNVADDAEAEAMYRFVSAARVADYRRRAELSRRAEAESELFVKLAGGTTTLLVVTGTPSDEEVPPYPKGALPTVELAKRLARDERFRRPFLSGYLIRLRDEGWVWYLSPLARDESLPRVRASDARPYPYRG